MKLLSAGYNMVNGQYLLSLDAYGGFNHANLSTFKDGEEGLTKWVESYLAAEGILKRKVGVVATQDPQETGKVAELVDIILGLNPKAVKAEPLKRPERKER